MSDRMTRVVSLPIREVVSTETRIIDAFRDAWNLSTQLSNWAQRELALRDVRRTPGMDKMPKYDRAAMFGTHPRKFARAAKGEMAAKLVGEPQTGSLYDLWNRECPFRDSFDGCAASARDILTGVERTWTNHKSFGRFAVMWKCDASASTFRWPYPWPVPSDKGKTLRIWRSEEGRPMASVLLPGGRVTVRLGDGSEYRRQLRQFDWLIANIDRMKQAKITGRFDCGRLVGADLRLVGQFDAAEKVEGVDAIVRTGGESLFAAVVDGDDGNPFVYHADHLKGIIHAYDRWRHRFARDLKHEKRWPADKRRRTVFGAAAQARMDKMGNRLDWERKQAAVMLVGFLKRRGVGVLHYDDSERDYLPRFDWTATRMAVACKCEEMGIEFQHIAGGNDAK